MARHLQLALDGHLQQWLRVRRFLIQARPSEQISTQLSSFILRERQRVISRCIRSLFVSGVDSLSPSFQTGSRPTLGIYRTIVGNNPTISSSHRGHFAAFASIQVGLLQGESTSPFYFRSFVDDTDIVVPIPRERIIDRTPRVPFVHLQRHSHRSLRRSSSSARALFRRRPRPE